MSRSVQFSLPQDVSPTPLTLQDFYTPMQPRHISFIEQSVQELFHKPSETLGIPPRFQQQSNCSTSLHKRNDSHSSRGIQPQQSPCSDTEPISNLSTTKRSLFVIFDKKAGWIRISDSAVGEIEFCEGGLADLHQMRDALLVSTPTGPRTRRSSLGHTHKGLWIPPVRIDLPSPPGTAGILSPISRSLYLLTRGKQTHMMPCPLPANVGACPAFRVLYWESVPTSVTARVCLPHPPNDGDLQPVVQVIGLGEGGVEVQEIALTSWGKGKGRARTNDVARSQADLGGDAGFLCHGGWWDDPNRDLASHLSRSGTFSSERTITSHDGPGPRATSDEGVYGWCRKGVQDWRVFWLGGSLKTEQYDTRTI